MIHLEDFGSQEGDESRKTNGNIELQPVDSFGGGHATNFEDPNPDNSDEGSIHREIGPQGEPSTLDLENPEESTTGSPQNALAKKIMALQQQRKNLTVRQRVAIVIGTLPVVVCSLEMIPDRCHVCRDDMELDAYFFTAAVCGGFAAVIYGDSLVYWLPRLVGGSISALGSLFTIWMVLTSIPSNLAFLLFFVGALGAMPGVLIYFLMKIVADECFVSDLDDYDEIAPLTKIRITSAD